jgi:hypothetical protein
MKYYKPYSNPLKPLIEPQIKAGSIVYTELGTCVKKVYIDENIYFIEVTESVLNDGETMSELTPVQVDLFWKLSKHKLEKHENKSKGERNHILS